MVRSGMLDVKVEGRHYQIPDIWLAGFCQSNKEASILDAVNHWVNQELLGEQEVKEREAHGERHA